MTGEFALIGRLREKFPAIGDDAAVVEPPTGPLLLAADAVVSDVAEPLAQARDQGKLVGQFSAPVGSTHRA